MRDQLTEDDGADDGALPTGMPPAEVIATFDEMAPRFDALLVDALHYRVPEQLAALLDEVAPGRRFPRALDLGCGTGLVGQLLRERCDLLAGVDLSPRMLERARARGVYDLLHEDEVVEHLEHTTWRPELVVAADLLIYLGDLEPLFAAVRAAVAGGGLFAASVEQHDGVDVHHAPTGRYQHSRDYVLRLAARHDLTGLACEPTPARLEAGVFVPAWCFVLAAGTRDRRGGRRR